jgi:hypothetical protein
MAILDPLLQEEPLVEQETLVITREWYSWLTELVKNLRAELDDVKARLDDLESS